MSAINDISNSSQQKSIERASKSKNPLENFPELMKYTTQDYDIKLYCKTKADMDTKTLKWAFKLAERNVGPYYKTNSIGWQPKIKQADLNKNWARYLVALDKANNPVAYAMFRFDYDYGNSVLYCYEMQIEKSIQRKGLGKFMMTAIEKCGKYWGMEKIVLTVLKNNPDGMAFFLKLGFTTDETSPDLADNVDYEILSKKFI